MKPKLNATCACWYDHKKVHKNQFLSVKETHTNIQVSNLDNAEYSSYATQLLSQFPTCCISLSSVELVLITQKFFNQLIFFLFYVVLTLKFFLCLFGGEKSIFSYLVPFTFVITECSQRQSFSCCCCSLFQEGYPSYAFFGKFSNCFNIISHNESL